MSADIIKLFEASAFIGQGVPFDGLWLNETLTERQAKLIDRQSTILNQCADLFAQSAMVLDQVSSHLREAEKLARKAAGEKI